MARKGIRHTLTTGATLALLGLGSIGSLGCQTTNQGATAPGGAATSSPSQGSGSEDGSGNGSGRGAGSIVPAAGSKTALGFTAMVRHETGPEDGKGTLVLRAPDGRHAIVGEVSDGAEVADISSNARTVVTAIRAKGGGESRYTIWDTATGKPTYVRVKDGGDAVLVQDGLLVARPKQSPQLFDRSGKPVRTYEGSFSPSAEVVASADGKRFWIADDGGRIRLFDLRSGTELRQIEVPSGRASCSPGPQLSYEDFTMDCSAPGDADPSGSTAYMAQFYGTAAPQRLVDHGDQASQARRVNPGLVYEVPGVCGSAWISRGASYEPLKVDDSDTRQVAGAYGDTAYLTSWGGQCGDGDLVRFDLANLKSTKVAGKGTPIGGFVTSAKTVDGT